MTSAGNETEYAFWADEINSFRVNYSLPLFHEIDFQVNEGYRRIPHGGIEIGGILYGTLTGNTASIEAFRPIECEHATGPSFHLSERDLTQLGASLAAASNDEELKNFTALGWFIAHTRGPLRMTERELQLFNQLFPGTGKITLLIKPERFKPTRFGFIVRRADKSIKTDVSESAIILPLPGRAGSSSKGVQASIPAPAAKAAPPQNELEEQQSRTAPTKPSKESLPETREHVVPNLTSQPEPVVAAVPVLPSVEEIRKRRSENLRGTLAQEEQAARDTATRPLTGVRAPSRGRLLLVLMFAALLGCAAGYLAYLQLPPTDINLRVHRYGTMLLVQWSPEQTQNAGYAAIRVDNGPSLPLTADQKASGQVEVKQTSGNMKIELTAQHWIRNSRGIVRFISLPGREPR
jgi:hypothetical protein